MHMSPPCAAPILLLMTTVFPSADRPKRASRLRRQIWNTLAVALVALAPTLAGAERGDEAIGTDSASDPAMARQTGAVASARTAPRIEPLLTVQPVTDRPRSIPQIAPVVTIAPMAVAAPGPTTDIAAALGLSDDASTLNGALTRPIRADTPAATDPDFAAQVPVETSVAQVAPFRLLDETVAPGTFAQLTWSATETFSSAAVPAAVLIAHGSAPGPVVCLTAAIHGDELNGIETIRRVMHDLDPGRLSGTVVGVPIVNIQGFHRGSRYLPDRRDLNRFFPGNRSGSSASRIAHSLFFNVIVHCNALVDLHTGSFHRANLPQVRADLNNPGTLAITQGFGSTVILHGEGAKGTLRRAATDAGIPAVTLEAGGPMEVQEEAVSQSEQGLRLLLDHLGMYREPGVRKTPVPAYYRSRWVRTDHGGILSSRVELGHQVLVGDLLGTVVDPLTNQQQEIRSPLRGRVIGMALDQFVMPGYATYHIGIEGAPADATETPESAESEFEAAEIDQGFDPS
jgi:uncharacterized protein